MTPELALVEDPSRTLVADGEVIEREIAGVGLLRFEDLGPGEWLTQRGEPARVGRRRYLLDGREFVSVSSVTETLGKPAIVPWAERKSIEGTMIAVREGQIDVGMDVQTVIARVEALGLGGRGARDEAAERGKAIHTVFYRYVTEGVVPAREEFPEAWWPWVQGAAKALLALDPEPDEAEQPVCDPYQRYAGRPDLIARCRYQGRRARLLLDYKTGRGRVYDSAHYQTRLYDGCLEPCGIEPVEDILIIGVSDTGDYQPVKCEATELDALGLLTVHRSRKRINAGMAAQRARNQTVQS